MEQTLGERLQEIVTEKRKIRDEMPSLILKDATEELISSGIDELLEQTAEKCLSSFSVNKLSGGPVWSKIDTMISRYGINTVINAFGSMDLKFTRTQIGGDNDGPIYVYDISWDK